MSTATESNTSSVSVDGLRLSVEVVSVINRFGYKLDDHDLIILATLCSRAASKNKDREKRAS